jgi:hypothetical protein
MLVPSEEQVPAGRAPAWLPIVTLAAVSRVLLDQATLCAIRAGVVLCWVQIRSVAAVVLLSFEAAGASRVPECP